MKRVFLGGTCNGSEWRTELISKLSIDYFNPVVPNWTTEAQVRELEERKICDYCLYVITPKMVGVYSIAEVVDDSNKRPMKTILCVLEEDGGSTFNAHQLRSLHRVGAMIKDNGANYFESLDQVAKYLNR